MTGLSKIFSYLFHPLLMASVGVTFLMFTGSYITLIPDQAKKMLILLAVSGTFVLPAVTIPFFMLKGRITTVMLGERKERYFPLAITLIFYILTYFLFQKLPVYRFLHGFILGSTLTVGVVLIATIWFKMSAHLAGIGGISALLFIMSLQLNTEMFYLFLVSVFIGGVTGTARTYLGAHTLGEVILGYFAGLLTMGLCLLFY